MGKKTSSDFITLLRPRNSGQRCAKRFIRKGDETIVQGYTAGAVWVPEVCAVPNFESLHEILEAQSQRSDTIVVYGEPLDGREEIRRRKLGNDAALKDADHRWLAIDVDGAIVPENMTPTEQARHWWENHLPTPLRGVTCWYQLTSSAGTDELLHARYWFWMDEAVPCEVLRQRFKHEEMVDESVFVCTQPIYICSPVFLRMADPIARYGRSGVFEGLEDIVAVADLKLGEAIAAAEESQRARGDIQRRNIEVDDEQIRIVTERILGQNTDGARHHHLLGAVSELYLLGADIDHIIAVGERLLIKQGRDPVPSEVVNAVRYAIKMEGEGKLHSKTKAWADILPELPEDAGAEDPSAPASQASQELSQDMLLYDETQSDLHNVRVFMARVFNNVNYLRWRQRDWMFNGMCWEPIEDSELLGSMLSQDSGGVFGTSRLKALVERIRLHYQNSGAELNTWLDEHGTDGRDELIVGNGIVNVQDALLDPASCLRPHNPKLFSATARKYHYDPKATCPRWEQCVSEWFHGDPASMRELQKMAGYLLTTDNRFERFFVLTDQVSGRTGKGTCSTVLEWLIGSRNVTALSLQGLANPHTLHQLIGKSVCFLNEANVEDPRDVPQLTVDRLKMITGNDSVDINPKHKEPFAIHLESRFVMSANTLPALKDPSGALLRRAHVLEFLQSFQGRADRTLKNVGGPLHRELSGIFNWALKGLFMLHYEDKEFFELESSREAKDLFKRRTAPIAAFMDDCVSFGDPLDSENRLLSADLYGAYTNWCLDQNIKAVESQLQFNMKVRPFMSHCIKTRSRSGGVKRTTKRAIAYDGACLTEYGRELLTGEVLDEVLD